MKLTKTIISKISLISFISLVSFVSLVSSCGGGGSDDLGAPQMAGQKEELVPITFNGSQGVEAAVTRASGTPLSEKAQQFHVWGYKNMTSETQTVFPGYQVDWGANTAYTTTSNTNNWDYIGTVSDQTIKYWDWGAQAYRFFAVTKFDKNAAVPATVAGYDANKAYGTDKTTSYEVSMLANTADIKDNLYFSRLWYSTGNPTNYPDKQFGKPVTLEFLKPYARVRFIYTYVYPREGIVLTEQTFMPTDGSKKTYSKGIVTVTYPLTGTDTKEWYSMAEIYESAADSILINQDYDPEDDTKTYYNHCVGGWYTVIPNTSQGSYTLSVTVSGQNKTAVVPAEYMQWKPGYSYTYIFKITDKGGIEIGWVDYKVTPWTEMEVSKSVYNW